MSRTYIFLVSFFLTVIASRSDAQAKGYGLLIGATRTYDFTKFDAMSVAKADKDAESIKDVLTGSGFLDTDIVLLEGEKAKVAPVLKALSDFSLKLKKGDLFVFYFSGHGDTVYDSNHDELPYTFDQRIILADGAIVDDALHGIFNKFRDSVRIVFIADACFSGHMYEIHEMFQSYRTSRSFGIMSSSTDENNYGGCTVGADSARFNMLYIGATDRSSFTIPFPDGSGRLTKWITDAWHYMKRVNLLESLSMLDFFRQACFSSSETIIIKVEGKNKNVFGNGYVFKL